MDRFSHQLVCYEKNIYISFRKKKSVPGDASNFQVLLMKDRDKQSFILHTKVF